MRMLITFKVVGINTPNIVPIFSSAGGFLVFPFSVMLLREVFTLFLRQKCLRRGVDCASISAPVAYGPDVQS
jgi:hypothetical protein